MAFKKFVMSATRFVNEMRVKEKANEFRSFLIKKSLEVDEDLILEKKELLTDERTRTDSVDVTRSLKKESRLDLSRSHPEDHWKKKLICNKLVVYRLLPNDFDYWLEIDCYKRNSDIAIKDQSSIRWIMRKARLIFFNFLNSAIRPSLRVNVPAEMIERVRKAINLGVIWRSIFHETFLHLFPVLLHFWKEYRKAKFSYWKIKSLITVHQQEANYKVKKFNSGLALPIFSVTNLCNRKPMESFKVAAERKKKEKIEKEAFLHLKCRDMTRVQNYVTKDEPETRIDFSLRKGPVVINSVVRKSSPKRRLPSLGQHTNLESSKMKIKMRTSVLHHVKPNNNKQQELEELTYEDNPDTEIPKEEFIARFNRVYRDHIPSA